MALTAEQTTAAVKLGVAAFGAPISTYTTVFDAVLNSAAPFGGSIENTYTAFLTLVPPYENVSDAAFATAFVDTLLGDTVSAEAKTAGVSLVNTLLAASGATRGSVALAVIDALIGVANDDATFGAASARLENRIVVAEYYTANGGTETNVANLQGLIATVGATTDVTDPAAIIAANTPTTFALAVDNATPAEGANAVFTVTASKAVTTDTVVKFKVMAGDPAAADQGTGNTNLNDFAAGTFNEVSVTILAGQKTATFTVGAVADGKTELPEAYSVQAVVNGQTFTQAVTLQDGAAGGGQSFTLTTGVDTFAGTSGMDTFTGTETTYTGLDNLDGGAGIDTLVLNNAAGTVPALGTATVKNVENVVINSAAGAITADVSTFTGVESVKVNQTGTADAIAVTTKGNATSVATVGGTTVAISDSAAAGADKLTSASVSGNTGAATIASDKLTSLSLANTAQNATVTAAAATRALELMLNNVTGGTIADAEATTLTVTASGTKSTGATVDAAKATTVTVAADEALTLANLNVAAATTLTVTGDSLVTLTAGTYTALKTVDASASTGGLSLGTAIANDVLFTGGAGKDSVSIGATTKVIDLGAGDDTVVIGVGALGTGGAVKGGDGTDTVSITAANAVTASADAKFATAVTGFEKLMLTGATNQTIDAKALGNFNFVSTSGGNGLTINNLTTGATLELTGAGTAYTVAGADFTTGTADVLNLALKDGSGAAVAFASTGVTATKVETVAITNTDTQTTPTGTFNNSVTLLGNDVKMITVTGNAGLTLTAASTAATTVDASGITKGGFTFTAGALAGDAVIKGSAAGANTVNLAAATKAVIYTGGTGVDTVTLSNNAATVDLGAGNDVLTLGKGLATVTLGAGNDTVNIVAPTSGNTYSTITDLAKGDSLSFVDQGVETFTTAKLTLADTAVFQDFLDAAAAGDGSTNGAIKWFEFAGNTYVVEDLSAAATFQSGTDVIIKLTGLVDLSTATGAGTNVIALA